jgi:hypothetical protein
MPDQFRRSESPRENMPNTLKILLGLVAALAVGAISHGPLGRGEAFVAQLDAGVQQVVRDAEVPGVTVQMAREPLSRRAILTGPADRFQREGQGSLPGIDERVLAVPGMGRVEWTNPPP